MCVASTCTISCLYSTFLLFPGQCNKWCDDRQYQFHRRKCDRDTHWLGNGKVCSTFHDSIMCHIVESIRHFRILEYLGILSNIVRYFLSLNYIVNVLNAIIDYIVIDIINCKTFFNQFLCVHPVHFSDVSWRYSVSVAGVSSWKRYYGCCGLFSLSTLFSDNGWLCFFGCTHRFIGGYYTIFVYEPWIYRAWDWVNVACKCFWDKDIGIFYFSVIVSCYS